MGAGVSENGRRGKRNNYDEKSEVRKTIFVTQISEK